MLTIEEERERAIVTGLSLPGKSGRPADDSLAELTRLADTAGAVVVERVIQRRDAPDPAFYIGRGRARELGMLAADHHAGLIIFDDELSGAQLRNLEEETGVRVVDRTQLILDIFARRARTREGKLQVELAQLSYALPRLTGKGTALSRLGGGIGTRGPGETKLEVDRRRIKQRISDLRQEIEDVRRQRSLQREGRRSLALPVVALVGYTNAGKSSLMNMLTGAGVMTEDRLFATLDPTTRLVRQRGAHDFLLTDTVGFIHKLPHELVAAFRGTLEEVTEADLLLHVIDASHPEMMVQAEAVWNVLRSLGVEQKPVIEVLNKVDRLPGRQCPAPANWGRPWVCVSALDGWGVPALLEAIDAFLSLRREVVRLDIPYARMNLLSLVHQRGRVIREAFREEAVSVEAEVDCDLLDQLRSRLEQ